jgi:Tfp pilus assembly protein PilF
MARREAPPPPPEIDRADNRLLQGDPAGAEDQLDRALAADPDLFAAHYRRGVIALLYGEADAVEHLRRAEELDPSHPGPPIFLGTAFHVRDPQAASAAYRRGVVRAEARRGYSLPDTSAAVAEALAHLDGNRPAEALALLEPAVQEDGNAVMRFLLARAEFGAGDARGAREELARVLRADPGLAPAHALDAAAAYALRSREEAAAAVDAALALDPHQPLALQVRGFLLLEDNEFRDAFHAWWDALLADPTMTEAYQALGGHLVRYELHELGSHVLRVMDPTYRFLRTHYGWPGSDR